MLRRILGLGIMVAISAQVGSSMAHSAGDLVSVGLSPTRYWAHLSVEV